MISFDNKGIKPMLIGKEQEAFDSLDYLYEIKWDGERCIAYLDPTSTDLRNKRNFGLLPRFPELSHIHKQVNTRCILDGELAVLINGKPDFSIVQRRSLISNQLRISIESKQHPATLIVYDILYYENRDVTLLPLTERKELLSKTVSESSHLVMSRSFNGSGKCLFGLTTKEGLEGIVAKRKDSIYIQGKKSANWIKCKNYFDDDFIICGYIHKSTHMVSLVLGKYGESGMVYYGHVTIGKNSVPFKAISSLPPFVPPFSSIPPGNDNAKWVAPSIVCTVKYMQPTKKGGMRQATFKGLRPDKLPSDIRIE